MGRLSNVFHLYSGDYRHFMVLKKKKKNYRQFRVVLKGTCYWCGGFHRQVRHTYTVSTLRMPYLLRGERCKDVQFHGEFKCGEIQRH